jgi:hypothetical protein
MANHTLGTLTRVKLRNAWSKEDTDFTPWLAEAENIAALGEALRLNLETTEIEKYVGPFRADILAKDVDSDSWVLIENQLERTDHKHLGQLRGLKSNSTKSYAKLRRRPVLRVQRMLSGARQQLLMTHKRLSLSIDPSSIDGSVTQPRTSGDLGCPSLANLYPQACRNICG